MQKKLKKQSGQAIIEFAIIIPFFIFMLMGFVYLSMLCHDYLTLTEMARAAARKAAVGTMTNDDIRTYYGNTGFFTEIYTLNTKSTDDFKIEVKTETPNSTSQMVIVTLTARRAIGNLDIMGMDLSLPATIQTSLAMHKE